MSTLDDRNAADMEQTLRQGSRGVPVDDLYFVHGLVRAAHKKLGTAEKPIATGKILSPKGYIIVTIEIVPEPPKDVRRATGSPIGEFNDEYWQQLLSGAPSVRVHWPEKPERKE